MNGRWRPFELHTHTAHSDGDFSASALAAAAERASYAGFALTDHNTRSGLAEAAEAAAAAGLVLVPGMEWTTFFGHVLLLGNRFFDWRDFGSDGLFRALGRVRESGALVGAAHPFLPGNPFCTGCYWEFENAWPRLDYVEVWSGGKPSERSFNKRALALWKSLLSQGWPLKATAGRDWHREADEEGPFAATFLNGAVDAVSALGALRSGDAVVSYGPLLEFAAENAGGAVAVDIELSDSGWGIPLADAAELSVRVVGDPGVLAELHPASGAFPAALYARVGAAGLSWLIVELWGRVAGVSEAPTLIAFTNPVFIPR